MEPSAAARSCKTAAELRTRAIGTDNNPNALWGPLQGLSTLVSGIGLAERRQRALSVVTAVGLPGAAPSLACLAPAVLALQPLPAGPLSEQDLVDLLKAPLCVGSARRVVLDELGRRHGRTFADQWDFVRFAEERHLGLDLLGPPKRSSSSTP